MHTLTIGDELTSNEGRVVSLFRVTVSYLGETSTHYVMAQSEDGAMSQARCARKVAIYNGPVGPVETIAQQIPFLVEGWGRTQFG